MKYTLRMRPRPVRKVIGDAVFEAPAYTAEVDVKTAADLLTQPGNAFQLATRPSAPALRALAQQLGVKPENIIVPDGEPEAAPEAAEGGVNDGTS